jgi:hypothetical protein
MALPMACRHRETSAVTLALTARDCLAVAGVHLLLQGLHAFANHILHRRCFRWAMHVRKKGKTP